MAKYIKDLEELGENSLAEAGGKGSNLGVLINAGLPVPPGFIITSKAYRLHIENSGVLDKMKIYLEDKDLFSIEGLTNISKAISGWIVDAPMSQEIENEVIDYYEKLAHEHGKIQLDRSNLSVAVRSSATAEDLPSASFAGQQETYLGILGIKDVLKHIKMCWASLWTPQAISYRENMKFEHLRVDLAVVIQVMVNAEMAGVMFTANPVSGSKKEVVINSNYGLGETVVAGTVTPDTITLTKDGLIKDKTLGTKEEKITLVDGRAMSQRVDHKDRKKFSLTDNQLLMLLELAMKVEKYYGSPQDTEWAISEGELYLLQARPITTLSVNPIGNLDLKLLWKKKKDPVMIQDVMEHSPEPLTPLDMAVFCIGDKTFQQAALGEVMGMKPPKRYTKPVERSNGMIGIQLEQAGFSPAVFWRMPKSLISRAFKNPMEEWKPIFEEMMDCYGANEIQRTNFNDIESMVKLLQRAIDDFEPLMYKRFSAVFMSFLVSDMIVGLLTRKAVGKSAAKEVKPRLLRALPFRTAVQNGELTQLAVMGKEQGTNSLQFERSFKKYLDEYGVRPARGMISMPSIPTLKEDSRVVMELVNALINDPESLNWQEKDKNQESDYKKAKLEVEKLLSKTQKRWFNNHLKKVRNGEIVREESLFIIEKLIASIREIALKLGDLLEKEAIVNEKEDVFYLFIHELHEIVAGSLDIKTVKRLVCKRKNGFKIVFESHQRGQHWMITTGSVPKPKTKKKSNNKASKLDYETIFSGISASQGLIEGRVCIVKSPSEFNKIRKGDILVAPFTAPVWTPLFRIASAVVTEIGSPTCHAAIVSREYGIPSVVAIPDITNLLKDGQRVVVDGTNGIVGIAKKKDTSIPKEA